MPWKDQGGGWQGGGGGGGRGPWGPGPGGPQPPNLEELLQKGQDRLRGLMPGGSWSGWGIVLVVLGALVLWIGFTGVYKVAPYEQGVVLRFGKWVRTTPPGLNFKLPWPIETVLKPNVTTVNRIGVGYRRAGELGRGAPKRDIAEESLMLTGDENIIDIDFVVFWYIKDAGQYLFNIDRPEATVKAVAESAMREIVGKSELSSALTKSRQPIEVATQQLMQDVLDRYGAGINIKEVKMEAVDPPRTVIDAFRDVQAAKADLERQINEAEAYRNDVVPRARGEAERILQEAEGYKSRVIAEAKGETARFLSVLNEFRQAKEITTRRLYLETMEEVLSGMNKIIIDNRAGSGVVPYLPLPELKKRSEATQ